MVIWKTTCLKRFHSHANKEIRKLLPSYMKATEIVEPMKKRVRVALIGFTNAGKSTLINSILGLHLCPVSKRPLTTKEHQKVNFVVGDTNIIFVDTPGFLSKQLQKASPYTPSEEIVRKKVNRNIDIIGLIVDSSSKYSRIKIRDHLNLIQTFAPEKAEKILILNKVDKLKVKMDLLTLAKRYHNASHKANYDDENDQNNQNTISNQGFSQVFMISALKNDGVEFLVKYFVSKACEIPEETIPKRLTNHGDAEVIENRVRAALLEYYKEEVPYRCKCELQLMSEHDGILSIVVTVYCSSKRVFVSLGNITLQKLAIKDCTKDFTQIFNKPVSLLLNLKLKESLKIK